MTTSKSESRERYEFKTMSYKASDKVPLRPANGSDKVPARPSTASYDLALSFDHVVAPPEENGTMKTKKPNSWTPQCIEAQPLHTDYNVQASRNGSKAPPKLSTHSYKHAVNNQHSATTVENNSSNIPWPSALVEFVTSDRIVCPKIFEMMSGIFRYDPLMIQRVPISFNSPSCYTCTGVKRLDDYSQDTDELLRMQEKYWQPLIKVTLLSFYDITMTRWFYCS